MPYTSNVSNSSHFYLKDTGTLQILRFFSNISSILLGKLLEKYLRPFYADYSGSRPSSWVLEFVCQVNVRRNVLDMVGFPYPCLSVVCPTRVLTTFKKIDVT